MPDQVTDTIDVHAHVVPPQLPGRVADDAHLPSVSVSHGEGDSVTIDLPRPGDLGPARRVLPALMDLGGTVGRLTTQRIGMALLSIWPDLVGSGLDTAESERWAEIVNDCLLEVVSGDERLSGLACVPIQAARPGDLLARAKESGFVGGAIGTRALDYELDDPRLEPLWEAASGLGMPLFLHPHFHGADERLSDDLAYGLANSVGRANDTTVAMSRFLLSGMLDKYPALKLVVAHGGGGLPYLLGRLRRVHEIYPSVPDATEGFAKVYFDSVVLDGPTLHFLVELAGASQVMLGSDYPFANGDPDPRTTVESARLDSETLRAVLGGNARTVFRL